MAKKIASNEGAEVEVIVGETETVVPPASTGGLVVIAPFELERNFQKVEYKEGDFFPIPEGWTRDLAFEEFRKINTKNNPNGIAFSVPNPVLDEKGKLKYMDSKRVLLPLKEV
jgi:hypothetical protein